MDRPSNTTALRLSGIVLAAGAAACTGATTSSSDAGPGGGSDAAPGGPPAIVSLDTSATALGDGDEMEIVVWVDDPDGLSDVAGGVLGTPDGRLYGAFAERGAGLYALTLRWDALALMDMLSFAPGDGATRTLVATFRDRAGLEATASADVLALCRDGAAACNGMCLAPDQLTITHGWGPAAPLPVAEDFESAPLGEAPGLPFYVSDSPVGLATRWIRTMSTAQTGITAASGTQFLMFTKDAGPYLYEAPNLSVLPQFFGELLRLRFALRLEPGMQLNFGVVDEFQPDGCCANGAGLYVAADGNLFGLRNTVPLYTAFPTGVWVTLTVDERADPLHGIVWDVTIEPPGGAPVVVTDAVTGTAARCGTSYVVFSSPTIPVAPETPVFELDDILIERIGP